MNKLTTFLAGAAITTGLGLGSLGCGVMGGSTHVGNRENELDGKQFYSPDRKDKMSVSCYPQEEKRVNDKFWYNLHGGNEHYTNHHSNHFYITTPKGERICLVDSDDDDPGVLMDIDTVYKGWGYPFVKTAPENDSTLHYWNLEFKDVWLPVLFPEKYRR